MDQVSLWTGRIELVPLAQRHLDDVVALDGDPEVMRYLDQVPGGAAAAHRMRLAVAERGLGFWAGSVGGEFVGWWALEPAGRTDRAELGYRLLRRFWRKGLASEGARELVRHGFAELGLAEVFAETMAVNAASRATMSAVGLRYRRTFHLEWDEPLPGAEHGEVEYAITRAEWVKLRAVL